MSKQMKLKRYAIDVNKRTNLLYRFDVEYTEMSSICDTIVRFSSDTKLGSGHLISITQNSVVGHNNISLGYMTPRQIHKLFEGKSSKRNHPMTRLVSPQARRFYPNVLNDDMSFKFFVYCNGLAYETRFTIREDNKIHLYQAGNVGLEHIFLGDSDTLIEFIIDAYNRRNISYLDIVINEREEAREEPLDLYGNDRVPNDYGVHVFDNDENIRIVIE